MKVEVPPSLLSRGESMERAPVVVIGGGITGLTAAFTLHRAGFPVVVLEASSRVGGAIRSIRREGYLAEAGPNTILETSPKISKLLRDARLEQYRLDPAPSSGARYLVHGGRPVLLPESPLGFLRTELFSTGAKLALLREPFIPARRAGSEESVADFVRRRLGREFLEHAVDAMVAGVYAGDPERLSLSQAFPKLAALEDRYGSLIRGTLFGRRDRQKRGEVAKDRAPKFSFDEGLQVLPDALAGELGTNVRLESSVTSIIQEGSGWRVCWESRGEVLECLARSVVYAGTAHRLGGMRLDLGKGEPPLDFSPLAEIRHPPVASVVLGFRREEVDHPCQGFGVLIPRKENFSTLGTIFSSSLFPNRAPDGHLTLTTYVGGERAPELAMLPEDELIDLVQRDLRILLGVRGKTTFRHCTLHPRAIPQYNLGYGRYRELMDSIELQARHFYFAGQYRDGISLSDSILAGIQVAGRIQSDPKNLSS